MTTNLSRTPHERLRLFVPSGGADRRPLVRRHVLAGRDRLRADLQDLGRAEFRAGRDAAVRGADLRRHSRARRALLRQSCCSRSSIMALLGVAIERSRCCGRWSTGRRSPCSWRRSASPTFSKARRSSSGARKSTGSISASTIRRCTSVTCWSARSICLRRLSRQRWLRCCRRSFASRAPDSHSVPSPTTSSRHSRSACGCR